MKASCLYVGEVEHRRFMPKRHEFRYRVLYYFLDLDEVSSIFKFPFLLSHNFPGILSFWRKDYLGLKKEDLKTSVINCVRAETGETISGPIRLMTNISYFGFCFNPVSFYYCYAPDGETLKYIVSEITNTPWGEKHRQVFPFEVQKKKVYQFPKTFHVSPFLPMTMDYTWVFEKPQKKLYVLMQNRMKGLNALFFDTTLELEQQPLTVANIIKFFLKFPFVTFKTMAAIYYQAARLYLKKIPFYTHPAKEKNYDHSSAT